LAKKDGMQLNKGIPLLIIAWLTPKGYWKLEGNNQVDVQIGGKDVKMHARSMPVTGGREGSTKQKGQ